MCRPFVTPLVALAVALAAAAGSPANAPAKPRRTFDQQITLSKLGDATVRLKWQLPAGDYSALQYRLSHVSLSRDNDGKVSLKRTNPTGADLMSFLNLGGLDVMTKDVKVTVDDAKREITATFQIQGWARATGATSRAVEVLDNARWYDLLATHAAPLAATRDFTEEEAPAGTLRYVSTDSAGAVTSVVRGEVKLPEGATAAKLAKQDDGRWAVTYRLPAPKTTGEADAEVSFKVEPRREVMPALHKLYSDPLWPTFWLARTAFSNPTNDALRSVRVRARVSTSAGQTAWSEWEEVAAVVYPGQSAQFALTPVLDAKALMLTSKETAKLAVELEYANGDKKATIAKTARLAVLGRNDAAYTNLSLGGLKTASFYHHFQEAPIILAAFATPHDPVVKDLKGLISSHIGGQATMGNDAGSLKFAKALYDFFRANVAYSSPAGTEGEDGKLLQHVNYARNVLKNGTGTCIDLAVTYASVAEAAGLEAGIVLIPGHAFPYVVLPKSRRILYVEVVCCRTGKMDGSENFATALRAGDAHIAKDQPRVFSYLPALRKAVSAPELPKLDVVNPLKTWGRAMPPVAPEAALGKITVQHNVTGGNNHLGMQFTVPVALINGKGQEAELVLIVTKPDGTPYLNLDKKPHMARVTLKPDSDKLFRDTIKVHYPYACFDSPVDGVWYEFSVRVGVWAKTHQEEAAINPVADRMVLQRTAAGEKGKNAVVRSLLFVTRGAVDRAGKTGVELIVKDVQTGAPVPQGATTSADVLGGPTWAALKKPDGTAVNATATGVGHNSLWFADEEMRQAGSDKAKSLALIINFYDTAKKDWIMPKAVTVTLIR